MGLAGVTFKAALLGRRRRDGRSVRIKPTGVICGRDVDCPFDC